MDAILIGFCGCDCCDCSSLSLFYTDVLFNKLEFSDDVGSLSLLLFEGYLDMLTTSNRLIV